MQKFLGGEQLCTDGQNIWGYFLDSFDIFDIFKYLGSRLYIFQYSDIYFNAWIQRLNLVSNSSALYNSQISYGREKEL